MYQPLLLYTIDFQTVSPTLYSMNYGFKFVWLYTQYVMCACSQSHADVNTSTPCSNKAGGTKLIASKYKYT